MDEQLKKFLDDAAEQRAKMREQIQRNNERAATQAIQALRDRQELESLGRWVINKCLINGLGLK